MRVLTTTQRDEAWKQARCGLLCASDAASMLATIKSGEAAARRDLRLRLVCERLTNTPQEEGFVNAAMLRGVEKEAEARLAYEALTGNLVHETGFIAHDSLMAGCSPDGEIGGFKTLVEIKAPKSSMHLSYLRSGLRVPSNYIAQLTHQLWITGAEAVDFFSWDDRMPTGLQTFLVEFRLDEAERESYGLIVKAFLQEIEAELREVQALTPVTA